MGDYGTWDGIGISNLASLPASAAAGPPVLGAILEFFFDTNTASMGISSISKLGGISEDVTIPTHDFLESLLSACPWVLQVWCHFWELAFLWLRRIKCLLRATTAHPSSPARGQMNIVSYIVPLDDRWRQIDDFFGASPSLYHTMPE